MKNYEYIIAGLPVVDSGFKFTDRTPDDFIAEIREQLDRKDNALVDFLLDGYDYPGGNGKNCAPAFDKLGHGAIVCAGGSIAGAWLTAESDGRDFVEQALETLERVKRNLTRYTTIL